MATWKNVNSDVINNIYHFKVTYVNCTWNMKYITFIKFNFIYHTWNVFYFLDSQVVEKHIAQKLIFVIKLFSRCTVNKIIIALWNKFLQKSFQLFFSFMFFNREGISPCYPVWLASNSWAQEICPSRLPKCQDYNCEPPCLAEKFSNLLCMQCLNIHIVTFIL